MTHLSMKVVCEEVFGPIVSLVPFDHVETAIELVNDSPYGLQSGIFTRDIGVALMAAKRINADGGLLVT